jgi:hypothetical protein
VADVDQARAHTRLELGVPLERQRLTPSRDPARIERPGRPKDPAAQKAYRRAYQRQAFPPAKAHNGRVPEQRPRPAAAQDASLSKKLAFPKNNRGGPSHRIGCPRIGVSLQKDAEDSI